MFQELDPFRRSPPRRMKMLRKMRRPRHPAVPVYAVVAIPVGPILVLVEPVMVVADEVALTPPALVEHHVMEPVKPALRREVHLADRLRMVACFRQLTR